MRIPAPLRSVRLKLLLIALLPMVVLLPLLLGGTMLRWTGKIDDLLIVKVTGDLTIADQYLGRLLENSGERLDALAQSVALRDALGDETTLDTLLAERRDALGLDFLYLADAADAPAGFAPDDWPVIRRALDGRWQSAVDVLTPAQLRALSPDLATRAAIPIVASDADTASGQAVEGRGMIIHSAAPVIRANGGTTALVGGVLLNRNLGFIDTINALVYREGSLPEGSQGTATLFLDDLRISTNVRLFEDVRALGTRVSPEVRAAVLGAGRPWFDRAFVVNDWYISAYEPIEDSRGDRIGMLYVGFLEAPFSRSKIVSVLSLTLIFLGIAALSVPIFLRWAGHIFRPLERMTQTIARVEGGELAARNALGRDDDEIARVAHHLDGLLDQVQARDRELRDWAETLNDRVDARTRDLQAANEKLERTTERLIMSEKLAAVGEITAGVAHEINNPVAVIQGNLDVAREMLGPEAEKVGTEFRLIDDQVYRIGVIVSKLLQFARPAEFSGAANHLVAADVVRDCLLLIRHQVEAAGVALVHDLSPAPPVLIERTELQQVIVNLALNALHAMPGGGRLTIRCGPAPGGTVIEVEDTGTGMDDTTLRRIFDPFFTTKQAQGTGLGLSISQTLIARAGGRITATSTPGEGSRFEIWLPEVPLPKVPLPEAPSPTGPAQA
ncbi:HAMP domain-containing protein [Mesobaculum littorinae]|uniref:histidine kinase n=2 Tax=Mesobaculum littorinae TaxID=2486419 RepID=A0A438AFS9_9RHOB|nr:HAMP domain-containing protein [Mesobaculum littorinae]